MNCEDLPYKIIDRTKGVVAYAADAAGARTAITTLIRDAEEGYRMNGKVQVQGEFDALRRRFYSVVG